MARRRKGRTQFASTISPVSGNGSVSGLHVFRKDNGSIFYIASEGTKILSSTGAAFTDRTNDAPTNNANVFFTSLANTLVATAGAGMNPQKWDGVTGTMSNMTLTVPSGIPSPAEARYCCVYASSVWLASTAAEGSRLWKSAAGTVDIFNTVNDSFSSAIRPGDGDRIMNITPCGDVLMIPKQNTIYVGYGTSFDDLRFIPHNMANRGLIGERAWAVWGGLFIYCSADGIYAAGPNSFTEISAPIRNTYKAITDKTVIAGGTFEDQVWFAYGEGSSINSKALVFDARRGTWAQYYPVPARVLYRDIDGRLYGGLSTLGSTTKLMRFVDPSVTLDEGVSYDMVLEGGDLDFNERGDEWMCDKQGHTVWAMVKPVTGGTLSAAFYKDGVVDAAATIANRSIQAPSGTPSALIMRDKLSQTLRGRLLRWNLTTGAADAEIYGVGMEAAIFEPVGTDL
ncbi:hypothetical protein [Glutamicibacter sp.]|jgi:hypothetical protein|uniref:hypothetical protein n=1 Tax=Glutamicibacter sp. TaxID=1931995 RepID=UPI002FD912C2